MSNQDRRAQINMLRGNAVTDRGSLARSWLYGITGWIVLVVALRGWNPGPMTLLGGALLLRAGFEIPHRAEDLRARLDKS